MAVRRKFDLTYHCGLHARPSTALAGMVKRYNAKVKVINSRGETAHADSVIEVLSLGVQPGSVEFEAEGKDAEQVMEAISGWINKLNTENMW